MRKWYVKYYICFKEKCIFLKEFCRYFLGEIFNFFYDNIFEVFVFVKFFLLFCLLIIKMNIDVLF